MFHIAFKATVQASDGEPEQFITHYQGEIFVHNDETDGEQPAGTIGLYVVLANEADEADLLVDVLDLEQATAPYIALLDQKYAGNFIPAVLRILKEDDMVMSRNMIILDRLEILPKFRRKQLGLHVMQTCLDQFSGGSRIAAIKPYPLQFEGAKDEDPPAERVRWKERMGLVAFAADEKSATARLKKYYSQLGFVAVRGTDLMIRDLHVEHERVEFDDEK